MQCTDPILIEPLNLIVKPSNTNHPYVKKAIPYIVVCADSNGLVFVYVYMSVDAYMLISVACFQ